jgi:hypothetical protein
MFGKTRHGGLHAIGDAVFQPLSPRKKKPSSNKRWNPPSTRNTSQQMASWICEAEPFFLFCTWISFLPSQFFFKKWSEHNNKGIPFVTFCYCWLKIKGTLLFTRKGDVINWGQRSADRDDTIMFWRFWQYRPRRRENDRYVFFWFSRPYRREAPIGGCLYRKQLDLSLLLRVFLRNVI